MLTASSEVSLYGWAAKLRNGLWLSARRWGWPVTLGFTNLFAPSMVDWALDGRIGLTHGVQQRLRVNEERGGVHAHLRRGVRQLDFVAHFLLVVS